jgi:NADPH2:quinone reductase
MTADMKALRVHQTGGPEAMQLDDVPTPSPGAGDALVAIAAIGVNFIDVYFRTGLYKAPLPWTLGLEAAGTVEAVGPGVDGVAVGDRVAWTGVPGAYAEMAVVPAARLVKLPAGLSFRDGAAAMLQGMTAHYLACSTYPLKPGDTCLVHAAAGGVGLLLCQVAKRRGATVVATVSTEAKAELARAAGADHVILYSKEDFVDGVRRATGGSGVHVVYDGVGASTFAKSLDCLRPRGMMVLFGAASGPVAPFDPNDLQTKGSLFLTRPSLFHYIAAESELRDRAGDVLAWIAAGELKLRIEEEYPLARAADAHRALEGRRTTGKVLLVP